MDLKTEKRRKFVINAAYWAVILLLLYIIFSYIIGWLMPLLIGLAVARMLNPLIRFIARKTRIPRKLVAFVLVLLFVGIIGTLLFFAGMWVFGMTRDVLVSLPGYYQERMLPALKQIENWIADNLGQMFPEWSIGGDGSQLIASLSGIVANLPAWASKVFDWTAAAPDFLLRVLFAVLFALFGSVYYEEAVPFAMRQLPEKTQAIIRETFASLKYSIFSYCGAYFKIMAITFAQLLVGLSIVRGEFSILPAFLVAFGDFLPVLGTGTIMSVWALIHLIIGNFSLAAGLMVVCVIIFILRQFIEPKIVGDQLGLNPLLTLISMYLGYLAMGVMGMILLPIAVTIVADMQEKGKISLFK